MRRLRALAAIGIVGVLASGCSADNGVGVSSSQRSDGPAAANAGSDTSGTASDPASGEAPNTSAPTGQDPTSGDPSDDAFGWTDVDDGVQEGWLEVPFDPANPDAGQFSLYVVRHLATDPEHRIGSLLVNPGGPGFGGSDLAWFADTIYGEALTERFDIVGWDPRGTGLSEPSVDCIDDYDPFFSLDSSPDDDDERDALVDAAVEFASACTERSGEILPFISTAMTAGDMDRIRAALGEETISYFGFSYGSELGVTWASLYPQTVRAMVIDGAANQTVDYLEQNLEQAQGFEEAFDTYLARCGQRPSCQFAPDGDAAAAFDLLDEQSDADPVPGPAGRPAITQGVLGVAVSNAMYSESLWSTLDRALGNLARGDGSGIIALYDDYYGRGLDGTYDNALEAYFAINCLDDPGADDPQELWDLQSTFSKVAPRLGAGWILELQFCVAWPVPAAAAVPTDAAGAGPVVVVGTTGDAATPLASTRAMADALEDGRLVIVTADRHTGYGVNACVDGAIETYLVDLVAPADGLECP